MKTLLTQVLVDATQNPKVGGIVAAATTGSGILTTLEATAADIGNIATIIGIVLSIVLICTHLFRTYFDYKEHKLKMKLMEKEKNK